MVNSSSSSSGASAGGAISGPGGTVQVAVEEIDLQSVARRLSVGSSLGARVLESHGNKTYTVGFAGLRMVAESSVELAVGSRIGVEVVSIDAAAPAGAPKIHLRLLGSEEAALDVVLKKLGFEKPDARMRTIVSELMDQGLPVDRETVKRILAAMGGALGKNVSGGPVTLQQAVAMVSHDLPLSANAIVRSQAAQGSLASALERLESALIAKGQQNLADKIRHSLVFDGDLKALFDRHPLREERSILSALSGEKPRADDIKGILINLSSENSPETGARDSQASLSEIAVAARDLLHTLEGRYLMGQPGGADHPEPHVPFLVDDDGVRDASLSAKRSKERTNVRFSLQTSQLGEVVGVVDFHNRKLGISIGVPSKEARAALLAASEQLTSSLQALGLRVEAMTVDVLNRSKRVAQRPTAGLDIKI